MNLRHDDLIAPIRTRGPIRVRGGEAGEDTVPRPVRTRGALRTRGTPAVPMPRLKVERALTLEEVITELRQQVGDLPLTTLVHGWGSQAAATFVALLSPLFRKEDALWLIPLHETQSPPAPREIEGAVRLDLRRDTDQRTYRNLIDDLIFFPALEVAEAAQVGAWQQRTSAVVIDGRGPQSDAVLWAGCEAMLMTYRWSGETMLEEYIRS